MNPNDRMKRHSILLNSIILLIIVLLLSISLFIYTTSFEPFQTNSGTAQLVVARYEEDISWITEISDIYDKAFIYNKGAPKDFSIPKSEVKLLPNYGREGYVYLYHIVNNYNSLSDFTIFVQGSTWARADKKDKLLKSLDILKNKKTSSVVGSNDIDHVKSVTSFSLDNYTVSNESNRKNNPESTLKLSAIRPLGEWFTKHFPNETFNCVSYSPTIVASREDIQKRPVEFYKVLLEQSAVKNPEVEHYFERTWKHIMSIDNENCIG